MAAPVRVGRRFSVKDPEASKEFDALYALIQSLKLGPDAIDIRELAKVLGKAFSDGQIEPLNRALRGDRFGIKIILQANDAELPAFTIQTTEASTKALLRLAPVATHTGRFIDTTAGTPGAFLSAAGIWTDGCGARAKGGRRPVGRRRLWGGIRKLKIERWQSRRARGERHIGPTRENLRRAFGLREVSGYDLASIALRAVQDLRREVDSMKAEGIIPNGRRKKPRISKRHSGSR